MSTNRFRISESEWVVMNELWEAESLRSTQVVEALASKKDWSPKTIRTLLNRLVAKGVLTCESDGRVNHYSPRVSKARCVAQEGKSFLDRVFAGSASSMMLHFVDDLLPDEIDELRARLEDTK